MLKHVPRDVVAYATTSEGGSFFSGKSQVVLPIRFSARKGLHFFEHLRECDKSHSLNLFQDAMLHEQWKNHPEIRFGLLRFLNFEKRILLKGIRFIGHPAFCQADMPHFLHPVQEAPGFRLPTF